MKILSLVSTLVLVFWNPSDNTDSYALKVADKSGSFSQDVAAGGNTNTTLGMSPGATYAMSVTATNAFGTSPPSQTINFRPGLLLNVSTRASIERGDTKKMIVGFIIGGEGPKKVLIRVLGPSLTQQGVTGVLADPSLALSNGLNNDNWITAPNKAEIEASFAPTNDKESAILTTLQPGAYTATVSGVGKNATGIALAEVYDVTE